MHTSSSFDLAENREVANTVAKRHYAWIETQLRANRVEPSSYNVALAWNAGVNAVIRGSAPAVANDYATRVLNIAATLVDEESEPARPAPDVVVDVDETPAEPNLTLAPEVSAPAVSVASVEVVVAQASSSQDSPVEVRYYSNSILLALNRALSPETADEVPASSIGVVSGILVADDRPLTLARL